MKFAFLLALLIALVAVSSAAWTVGNAADEAIAAGSLFTLKFKTDAEVVAKYDAPVAVTITTGAAELFITDVSFGPGARNFCKDVDGKVIGFANVGAPGAGDVPGSVTLSLFDTAKIGDVSCVVRAAILTPSGDALKLTLGADEKAVKFTASAPAVEVTATATDETNIADWVHKVTLKFTGLAKNTLYGPITFHTKFDAEADLTAETIRRIQNKDYTVVNSAARFVVVGAEVFVWTAEAAAEVSLDIVYHGSVVTVWKESTKYTIYAKMDTGSTKAKESNKVELTSKALTKVATASISRDPVGKKVTFSCSFNPKEASGDFSFSVSGFDVKAYTGAGAEITYAGTKKITLVEGTTKYSLTDLETKGTTFSGSFPYTEPADWTSLETVECSLASESAKAKEAVVVYIKEISAASIATDVLSFSVVLASSSDKFKGSVSGDVAEILSITPGDVRAFGAEVAECEGASLSAASAKDGLDLNRVVFSASASLEDGSKTKTVTCTQKLLKDAVFLIDEVTVSFINAAPAKTVKGIKKADLATFNQKITIYANALTSTTFASTLDAVVADLITKTKEKTTDLKDLKVADLRFTPDTQHFGAAAVGRTLKFDTFVAEYSTDGAKITVAFNGPAPAAEAAYVPVAFTVYGADWHYTIEGTATATVSAFKDIAATFLDGKTEATYVKSAAVGHGLGVACNTSRQCAESAHCNNNVCTPWSHLTVAQQNALNPIDGSDTDSAMTAATVFAFALVVIALFF